MYTVGVEPAIGGATQAHYWSVYRASLESLRTRAAARHIYTQEEFVAELQNPAVLKYVGRDVEGVVQGMGMMSTDLNALPWINPDYFAARFPRHYATQRIYYCGIVLVHPDHQGGALFAQLMNAMLTRIGEEAAVGAFDVCRFNDETVGLPDKIRSVVKGNAGRVELLDVQSYYAICFDDNASDKAVPANGRARQRRAPRR